MKQVITLLFFLFFSLSNFAQDELDQIEKETVANRLEKSLADKAKLLGLDSAIEEGLRKNNLQMQRQYYYQINELDFKDAFDEFYFPKLSLSMATSENHFSESLYRDPISNATNPSSPNGYVSFGLDDYTLFNWGRDYLDYLNSKETYSRTKQRLKEQRRALRHNIITQYFNLTRLYRITQAWKKQLSNTSFIYRLAREKMGLKQINSQEFLQAKAEFLNAHNQYQNSLFEYYNQQQVMADLLGDDLDTIYRPTEFVKFQPMNLAPEDAIKFVQRNRPEILQAKTNVNNARRSYEKALKDNLPLPKLDLTFGAYQRSFTESGMTDDYSTFSNSRNVELVASIDMTWTLYGSGGFFNGRVTEKAYYEKRISEINLKEAYRKSKVANQLTSKRILYLERRHQAAKLQAKNSKLIYDKVIDNYISGKARFSDLRDVLQVYISTQLELENVKYEHVSEKVNYASLMGLDDFPGEKFEELVEK